MISMQQLEELENRRRRSHQDPGQDQDGTLTPHQTKTGPKRAGIAMRCSYVLDSLTESRRAAQGVTRLRSKINNSE